MTETAAPAIAAPPHWTRPIFIANLVAQCAIVVTGGIVRLTGSGLGCPTWPECVDGSIAPTPYQEESWHKYVEFGNRLLTFVLVLLALASVAAIVAIGVRRRRAGLPQRRPLILLALVPLVGTLAQAVLGGITVLTGLNPLTVAAHFLVSMALIAGCVWLVVRSGESADQPLTRLVPRPMSVLGGLLVAVAAVVLTLGTLVTASGPHSGDADVSHRLPIDPRMISWLHADAVLLFLGLAVGLLIALYVVAAPATARRRAIVLLVVIVVQGAIGYTQYFTGLPWGVVTFHVVGATVTWVVVLFLLTSLRRRG